MEQINDVSLISGLNGLKLALSNISYFEALSLIAH